MPGGPQEGYARVAAILTAVAAKVNGESCVAYLGSGAAGHYVKMVHNGIEYGLQQLLAETYDLLKLGVGLNNDELSEVYARWNEIELQSYLIEITAKIFKQVDPRTGQRVVDVIVDIARQKGTGLWTSQEAKDQRVPAPTIDLAVTMRNMSEFKEERRAASQLLSGPVPVPGADRHVLIKQIKNALYAATVITYAQGIALLRRASTSHKVQFAPGDGGPHLAGRLHYTGGAVGGHPDGLHQKPGTGQSPGGRSFQPGTHESSGRLAGRGPAGRGLGTAGARAGRLPGLLRRLPPGAPACQPHPGPARLLRLPHL